jgi:hypothetical protein
MTPPVFAQDKVCECICKLEMRHIEITKKKGVHNVDNISICYVLPFTTDLFTLTFPALVKVQASAISDGAK